MISFRYHIVSIVAVFLALALGIIVGASGLRGPLLDNLHQQVSTLKSENGKLRGANDNLSKQVGNADDFASSYGANVLKGILAGHTVALVSAPGASSNITKGVANAVALAGGTVTSRLTIQPAYADPSHGDALVRYVTGPARPIGLKLPDTNDAPALGAALLSYVLSGKANATGLSTVVAGLANLGLVTVSGDPKPAELAVLVTSGAPSSKNGQVQAMLTMVTRFSTDSLPSLVAGDLSSAQPSGLITSVRADKDLIQLVSTVDNADSALGQVSAALALAGLLTNNPGQYGTGPGATKLFPAPQ